MKREPATIKEENIKKKPKVERLEKIQRRETQIRNFYEQVDSGLYNKMCKELSFQTFQNYVKEKAVRMRSQLVDRNCDDSMIFNFQCPFPYFCAFASQFTYDRSSDVSFRIYNNHYTVEIKLSILKELEELFGKECFANLNYENNSGFYRINCSQLFPATLKFDTFRQVASFGIDFTSYKYTTSPHLSEKDFTYQQPCREKNSTRAEGKAT